MDFSPPLGIPEHKSFKPTADHLVSMFLFFRPFVDLSTRGQKSNAWVFTRKLKSPKKCQKTTMPCQAGFKHTPEIFPALSTHSLLDWWAEPAWHELEKELKKWRFQVVLSYLFNTGKISLNEIKEKKRNYKTAKSWNVSPCKRCWPRDHTTCSNLSDIEVSWQLPLPCARLLAHE